MQPVEQEAWASLAERDPVDVQAKANVDYDAVSSEYVVRILGRQVRVCVNSRSIVCNSDPGVQVIEEPAGFSSFLVLSYLLHAKELPLSGKLVKPASLPGGQMFVQGTHVLPLDRISQRFEDDPDALVARYEILGGVRLGYGDLSYELSPFPRIPIVLVLWSGDEEFPPYASLLLDSSCTEHMATDIIWSTAMMTVQMILM